jgi:hypothetical protein
MKKISAPLIALTVIVLSSCQKNDELLQEQRNPRAPLKQTCQILQISYPVGTGNDVLQFTYNSLGDPVSGSRLLGGHTGYPNFEFKYDEKNRLTDFIGPYDSHTIAETWHKYFYDGQGNIVLDSAYIFPRIVNGFPENAFSSQLTFYTYDNKDRIIKDSTVFSYRSPAVVHTYAYDAKGNKQGSTYDDKINVNRTHKIWMFLNRDYSVNNRFKANVYNATGLPVSWQLSPEENAFWFLGNTYQTAQISYSCDAHSL